MIESDFVVFVLGVTGLTKVCENVALIYNIIRIELTLQYTKRLLLYIHYFCPVTKRKLF
jgi:hypothetical protein